MTNLPNFNGFRYFYRLKYWPSVLCINTCHQACSPMVNHIIIINEKMTAPMAVTMSDGLCVNYRDLLTSTTDSVTFNAKFVTSDEHTHTKARFPLPELTARVNGPS